jgi:hypothetical protein
MKAKAQPKGKNQPKATGKGGRKPQSLQQRTQHVDMMRRSIKALFESNRLSGLEQISHLFTKAMADQLGVNHGRFLDKLRNPIRFSLKDLYKFSYYTGIEPAALMGQVQKEVENNKEVVRMLKDIKPLSDKSKAGQ